MYSRKASAVVGYLDQIHKMKKRGSIPNTLVMEHLINQVGFSYYIFHDKYIFIFFQALNIWLIWHHYIDIKFSLFILFLNAFSKF